MQVYDQLIRAQFQLASADLTPTSTGLVYFNTSSGIIRVHNGSGWKSLVDTDTAQVLTSKDIDGGTASNTSRLTLPKGARASLDALTRKQGTLVFDTTTNKPFYDDGTQLQAIGSGSGSGTGVNYITNSGAEDDAVGYIVYKDASQATPVDATGGVGSVTFARSTSLPLRGTGSFLLSKGASDLRGEGVSYDFTIASADVSKPLQISFDYDSTDANYDAGDIGVYIYDVTNSALITPAAVNLPKAKTQFQTTFVASTSTSYRLIFHVATTNASAYSVKFDSIFVGPQLLTLGTPVEGSRSYTPTFTGFGTPTISRAEYVRVADTLILDIKFQSGTPSATEARVSLPPGLNTASFSSIQVVGTYEGSIQNTSNHLMLAEPGLTYLTFGVAEVGSSGYTKQNGDFIANSSSVFNIRASVKIAQWEGSGVYLGTAQPEYAWNSDTTGSNNTSSFAYGPNGALIPNRSVGTQVEKDVQFLTPIQPTDAIEIQIYNPNSVGTWLKSELVAPFNRQSGTSYGVDYVPVNTNTIRVQFRGGGFLTTGASLGANGAPWADLFTANYRWRAVKIPGQVQVAVPQYPTATSMPDTIATQLGYKAYAHGTTYNGGIAPTVTLSSGGGTLSSALGSVFIPYQIQDGVWRLRINIVASVSSTSRSSAVFSVNGITFKNVASTVSQSLAVSALGLTTQSPRGLADNNASTISCDHTTATTTAYSITGDVELASKPTWAY